MRLEAVGVPKTLDGAKRNTDGLGHRAARPMGGFARRFGAGQRQHFRHDAGRKRRPAGLARLVAQETIDPFLAVSLLPAPNGRTANAGLIGNLQNRQALGRKENDQRPLHMLAAGNSLGQGYARLNDAEQQKQEIMQDAISRSINDATLRDQYTCDVSQDNDHLRSLGFWGVDPPDDDF